MKNSETLLKVKAHYNTDHTMKFYQIIILLSLICSAQQSQAKIRLPALFSNNMVLQRDTTVNMWGWGDPGEQVQVFASWNPTDTLTTTATRQAQWKLQLKTPVGPGPYTITIKGHNTITLHNVLLGEVWIASGQSNMEWSASAGITNKEEAIANAENANIRFFDVPRTSSQYPQDDVDAQWVESNPETMPSFSAIAYFFGKKLNAELDVPIGLIGANWGGTPAEIWMPEESFAANDSLAKAATLLKKEQWGPSEPGRAYNGMIAPLTPYTIAGVIWYQGETNTSNAAYYEYTFTHLITSWRQAWNVDFPFYFAQIAPYNYGDNFSGVEVRDAQRRTLKMPHTGMVVLGDLGEDDNIHPKNKRAVGLRFANLALANHYEKNILAESPLVDHVTQVSANKVEVYLKNGKDLHRANKERANAVFELAGADKQFQQANNVKIEEGKIIVRSAVQDPLYIRYGWGNIAIPGIYNAADLPMSSFSVPVEK